MSNIVYSNKIQLIDSEDNDSMTILTFLKIKFSLQQVKAALLHSSPKPPVRAFIEQFPWLANKNANILLRDFNIDAFSNEAYGGVSNVLIE